MVAGTSRPRVGNFSPRSGAWDFHGNPPACGSASRPHQADRCRSYRGSGTGSRGSGNPRHATDRDGTHGSCGIDPPAIEFRCLTLTCLRRVRLEFRSSKKPASRAGTPAGGERATTQWDSAVHDSRRFPHGRNSSRWRKIDDSQGRTRPSDSKRSAIDRGLDHQAPHPKHLRCRGSAQHGRRHPSGGDSARPLPHAGIRGHACGT